jgi:hypothetical protein
VLQLQVVVRSEETMSSWSHTKNPYLVTTIGVVLMAVGEIYASVRAMMFRAMFRPGGFNGTGGPGAGFGGGPRFGGGFGFGISNVIVILGLVLAIVGVLWLGLELRKPTKWG